MAFATVEEFLALKGRDKATTAEKALIDACRKGKPCVLGDGKLPPELAEGEEPPEDRRVRADLLRLLIPGGTPACGLDGRGVILVGAHVTGVLDLQFLTARGRTAMDACRFAVRPNLAEARFSQLSLQHSHLPGLFAQGIVVESSVFLRGLTAKGTVDVNSSRTGGMDLAGANLEGAMEIALNAQRMKSFGNVSVEKVVAKGIVAFDGAQIGGQLDCEGVRIEGRAWAEDKRKVALAAQGMEVAGSFILRRIEEVDGEIYLAAAKVGDLADEIARFGLERAPPFLDGLVFDRVAGSAPMTLAERQAWLFHGSHRKGRFYPQPYTQFARVLRASGHEGEARRVLFERDRLVAEAAREERRQGKAGSYRVRAEVLNAFAWVGDLFLRGVAGYGYRPMRSLIAALILIAIAWFMAERAWVSGAFAPNSDVLIASAGWQEVAAADCLPAPSDGCKRNPAKVWSSDKAKGLDWDSFNSLAYATDLVVPILDLGQTRAWAPSKDRGGWGFSLWYARWVFEIAGWLVTALGAAAVTGLMQRQKPD